MEDSTRGRNLKKPHNILPREKGKAEPGVIICPVCHAVYFDKHWHSSESFYNAYRFHGEVARQICPEDKQIELRGKEGWGGEVFLANIHPDKRIEVIQQVRHVGKRAMSRDPEARIIKIEDNGGEFRILTSENQLAVSIGKQIESAHKGGKLNIKWSSDDKPCRVIWKMK
jgi:hypothetical protein